MQKNLISIVVPVYNEQEVLPEFYRRTTAALANYTFEILFLDDGSKDKSWSIIEQLALQDPRVHAISFSRNFGHQAALTAGLENASGDALVLIDSDLQDPPELIPSMIEKWKEGYDVVYAVRESRQGETFFKKFTASLFYRILRHLSHVDIPADTGDFRLLSRRAVEALNNIPERNRYLRGLASWVGFKQIGIQYHRAERHAGTTKYPLFKMMKLAFDGITSFSSFPLQFSSYLGGITTLISLALILYSLIIRIFSNAVVKGWTSLMICIMFLGGIQLLMIGIIGEYVGRIYDEVKRRPTYLIRKKIGANLSES